MNNIERLRAEAINSLVWQKRASKGSSPCLADVQITIRKVHCGTGTAMAISFKDNLFELFTSNNRMAIAVCKNRIFFKEDTEGYKISAEGKRHTTQIRCTPDMSSFAGEYSLKYDDFLELYYIEKGNKNE